MVEKTVPFRNMITKDNPLNVRSVLIGRVKRRMMQPAYIPLRLPPITCPKINCQSGVGETMT